MFLLGNPKIFDRIPLMAKQRIHWLLDNFLKLAVALIKKEIHRLVIMQSLGFKETELTKFFAFSTYHFGGVIAVLGLFIINQTVRTKVLTLFALNVALVVSKIMVRIKLLCITLFCSLTHLSHITGSDTR